MDGRCQENWLRHRLSKECWAEARIKIARMTLTVKLDGNWSSFQLANSAPPLSVTDSAIAPSARMELQALNQELQRGNSLCGGSAPTLQRYICRVGGHAPRGLTSKRPHYPRGCAAPGKVQCQCNTQGPLSKLKRTPPQRKINVASKSPVGDISAVTLIRTDTSLDHSQEAEKE